MKKLLLFPILLLFFNSFSQDYVPFLDTNKMWIESYHKWHNTYDDQYQRGVYSLRVTPTSDSSYYLIKNVLYHTSWAGFGNDPNDYWNPYSTDYTVQENDTIALLIEDTLEKKVYLKMESDDYKLLYDFDMNLGDTALSIPFEEYSHSTFDSTSQELFLNDQTYTRYYLNTYGYQQCIPSIYVGNDRELLFYDEKMGGNYRLTFPFYPLTLGSDSGSDYCRICYSENNEVLWGDSIQCVAYLRHLEYGDLGINKIESKENSFSIYPNPVNSEMTVQFDEANQSGTIQVMSIEGKELLKQSFSNQNQVQIDLNECKSGMYLVRFYAEENRKILTKRIIKN